MRTLVIAATVVGALTTVMSPAANAQSGGGRGGEIVSLPIDRIVAVVGRRAITRTDLTRRMNDENARRAHDHLPPLPDDTLVAMRSVLQDMVDDEVILQKAESFKFTVPDDEIAPVVDDRMKSAQAGFRSEAEFLEAVKSYGLSSIADLRAKFADEERSGRLTRRVLDTLAILGKRPKVNVTEKEIRESYDTLAARDSLNGPLVSFRQIIIQPSPSDSADRRARKLADSLLAVVKAGGSLDSLARKFSADSDPVRGSAKDGGLLPFYRRDSLAVEFSKVAFSLPVGVLGPIVKTRFGYHILRVERVRAGEVQVRHLVIAPMVDQGDVVRAHALADSLGALILKGANYDSLASKYNDNDAKELQIVTNWQADSLPDAYKKAISGLAIGAVSKSFEVPYLPLPKVGVLQLTARNQSGIRNFAERHDEIRNILQQAASFRHMLDALRRDTYVSIRLDSPTHAAK